MEIGTLTVLGRIIEKLLNLNERRKKEVADYMEGIATTIEAFAPKLEAGAPTHQLTALVERTRELALRFAAATSDVLPEADRNEMIERLLAAFDFKSQLAQGSAENQKQLLENLGRIAGKFQGAADSLRGGASKFG